MARESWLMSLFFRHSRRRSGSDDRRGEFSTHGDENLSSGSNSDRSSASSAALLRVASSSAIAALYNLCILIIALCAPGKVVFSGSPRLQRASLVTAALSWTALVFGTLGILAARRRDEQGILSHRHRCVPMAGLAASLTAIFVGLALAALNAFYVAGAPDHAAKDIAVRVILGGFFVIVFVLASLDVLVSLLMRFDQIMPIVDSSLCSERLDKTSTAAPEHQIPPAVELLSPGSPSDDVSLVLSHSGLSDCPSSARVGSK